MKFAIGIPTLNRYDLLLPSLLLYTKDFPEVKIYVLDNGNQNITKRFNTEVIVAENLSVAASWNYLCVEIFKQHENALILNDDIYLGRKTADIEDLLSKKKHKGALIKATPDWCAFLLPKKIYETVGAFDERFTPAYYEDKDYEYRMKLKKIPVVKTPTLNPYVYRSSQTLEKLPSIIDGSILNKQRYINKWGGEPNNEKFK